MHGGMAPGSPAGALLQSRRMRRVPDVNFPGLPLHLGVTLQTKVRVALHEHFAVDRTMW